VTPSTSPAGAIAAGATISPAPATSPTAAELADGWRHERGTLVTGALLLVVAAVAWVAVVRQASMAQMDMPMPGGGMSDAGGMGSLKGGALFVGSWGVMMAAMMLPSAVPMIALYRTVSRSLGQRGQPRQQVAPTALFAATYLVVWLLFGVPVYLVSVAISAVAGDAAWLPYGVATVLIAAGAYQFTAIKEVCLKQCQSPLSFLLQRWKNGYVSTLRLGVAHAVYCLGCCWGLMAVLVAAGAMSLPWVLLIAAVVFAEKILPRGLWTARAIGGTLLVLGVAVAFAPRVAPVLRGEPMQSLAPSDQRPMPGM
jgi:predicted metal-binding membrane protein